MARRNSMFGLSPDMPQFIEARIENIRPNPHQPRKTINDKSIEQLAENIEKTGLKQPIVLVKTDDPDFYILGAGQRRLLAHKKLGRDTIPAMVVATGSPAEIALTENLQREDLKPLDAAEAMARLMEEYGYTQEQLAEFLGEQRTTVTEWLSINKLPDGIRQECRALDIGKTHLVTLARLMDRPHEFEQLLEQIRQGRPPTVREAQSLQRKGKTHISPADVPKALKPMYLVIETTRRMQEQLAKITPSSVGASQPQRLEELIEKLHELRDIHQKIGKTITKLTKDSAAVAAALDKNKTEEVSEETIPPDVSAENNIHVK